MKKETLDDEGCLEVHWEKKVLNLINDLKLLEIKYFFVEYELVLVGL